MNVDRAPEWLPSFLIPFVILSYPIDPPAEPDSFITSNYYSFGILDGCFVISCIVVMAILRDISRVYMLEPFARWFLTRRSIQVRKPAIAHNHNGVANGTAVGVAIGVANGVANGVAYNKPNGKANGNANAHTNKSANGHGSCAELNGNGVKRGGKKERQIHRSVLRFAEQGWSAIYYLIQWAFGMYVHLNLPTAPFKPARVWLDYPHVHLAGPLKFYYLTQTAFYMHQILIINAEARRKDHTQMMTHHVITVALMVASYYYNFTRVGCLIMVLMDWCDIWLPLAKMFRYLTLDTFCEIAFGFFTISWLITRHYFFVQVIWSTYYDAPQLLPFDWAPERGQYLTRGILNIFIAMLVALQVIQILWFQMILKVVWRVVSGRGAEDTRSDDEGDDSSEEAEYTKQKAIPQQSDLKKRA